MIGVLRPFVAALQEQQDAYATARHDPSLYRTERYGTWAACSCGWRSRPYTTVSGAHLAFGEHLLDVELERRTRAAWREQR